MVSVLWGSTDLHPPEVLVENAVAAIKAGFDGFWTGDHFHPQYHSGAPQHQAWVHLTAIAERAGRGIFGTCVTCPILRYNPAIVAQAFATMGYLYPGRVWLGVGTGEAENEYPVTSKWPKWSERIGRLDEAVKIIRMLWSSPQPLNYRGKYYSLHGAFGYTKPKQRIPIIYGALGPRSLLHAARYGDGFVGWVDDKCAKLFYDEVRRLGRDPEEMMVQQLAFCAVSPDIDKWLREMKHKVFASSTALTTHTQIFLNYYDPRAFEEFNQYVDDKIVLDALPVFQSVDELVGKLEKMAKTGAGHIAMLDASRQEDLAANLAQYQKTLLPHLRKVQKRIPK